jgi:hypothetical protein
MGVSEQYNASIFRVEKYANQHEEGSSKKSEKFPFITAWMPPEDGNKWLKYIRHYDHILIRIIRRT